ncbi:MAG TPA: diacylglycerol kinase family protein [Solirubrobacteraceae bacterium]|jgi:YegS/Rv2252/BmrU family lipid kinase|nr:diacylglycerol kinase family protein [Solirubrobacteraceae bacterium]
MDRSVTLIVNPVAGAGRAAKRLPAAEAELRALGIGFRRAETTSLVNAEQHARAAAEAGEAVFTLGGDGLVGAVAGALADTGTPLGVLSGGRGNDFARVLGIPGDPAEAVRALASAPVRRLDLAECDGRPFIGIASCGFDSVANGIANESRLVKGHLVYLYAALRALLTWEPARFELVLDGKERVYTGWSVGAANSKAYGGGMYAAPDAELDDGLLDVVVCERTSKLIFVTRVLPGLFRGTHVNLPSIHVMRAREVTVRADRPFAMYADGDPAGDLPVTVSIRPGVLAVLAP